MALSFPWLVDRVRQQATLHVPYEGLPYVDCAATDLGETGYQSVYDVTVVWGAASGTLIPVLIEREAGALWTGTASLQVMDGVARLVLFEANVVQGELADGDPVTVSLVLTASALSMNTWISMGTEWQREPDDDTYVIGDGDGDWHLCCTNSGPRTIGLSTDATPGLRLRISRLGTGSVTVTPPSGQLLNGDTVGVAIGARWRMATLVRLSETEWALLNA